MWSFTTSTLMKETEKISEMLVFNSALTQLIAREDFGAEKYVFVIRSF
jgi:hypothetical protein